LKISAFNQPLCTENMILCGKERHTLLLEGFLTLLGYIRMIGRAFDSATSWPW